MDESKKEVKEQLFYLSDTFFIFDGQKISKLNQILI